MSRRYDAAAVFYCEELSYIVKKFQDNPEFLEVFTYASKNYIEGPYAYFKWDSYKNFPIDLFDEITSEYGADLIIINEDDEIVREYYVIGEITYQSPVPLLPDEPYLQAAWRQIETLKKFLRGKGCTEEDIENILKHKLVSCSD